VPFLRLPGLPSLVARHVRLAARFRGGPHRPDVPLLSEPRAPLQGVLPEIRRRPALPVPPPKRRAAPDNFDPFARCECTPGTGAAHGEGRRPSWASNSLQRLRNRESASHGPLRGSPRSGLSVSHALAGLRLPKPLRAYFVPVTLLGFGLQGLSLPQGRPPLDDPSSLAVARSTTPLRAPRIDSASEACSLRESVPPASREARSTTDTLLAFYPLGLFVLLPRHRLPGASPHALG